MLPLCFTLLRLQNQDTALCQPQRIIAISLMEITCSDVLFANSFIRQFHIVSQMLAMCRVDASEVEKVGQGFALRGRPEVQVSSRAFKMSKSRGNVVNPDDIIFSFGADSLRLYEMFMGPLRETKVEPLCCK